MKYQNAEVMIGRASQAPERIATSALMKENYQMPNKMRPATSNDCFETLKDLCDAKKASSTIDVFRNVVSWVSDLSGKVSCRAKLCSLTRSTCTPFLVV